MRDACRGRRLAKHSSQRAGFGTAHWNHCNRGPRWWSWLGKKLRQPAFRPVAFALEIFRGKVIALYIFLTTSQRSVFRNLLARSNVKQNFRKCQNFIKKNLPWKIFFGYWLLFLFFTPVPKKKVHQSHTNHTHILHRAVGQICNLVTMNALLIVLVIKPVMTGPKGTQLMMKTTARAIHNRSLKVVSSMLKKIIESKFRCFDAQVS